MRALISTSRYENLKKRYMYVIEKIFNWFKKSYI